MKPEELTEFQKQLIAQLTELNSHLKVIAHHIPKIALHEFGSMNSLNKIGNEVERYNNFVNPRPSVLGGLDINSMIFGEGKGEEMRRLEKEKLKIEVQKLKAEQIEKEKSKYPKYNKKLKLLVVENQIIDDISPDTNESKIIEVLFSTPKAMIKEWSWDEVVEKWGDNPDNFKANAIYNAGNRINSKVAQKTQIKELLLVTTKTIRINPIHLQ